MWMRTGRRLGSRQKGDDVNIVFSDDVARTVAYTYDGPPIAFGTLKLDMTGPGTNDVALSSVAYTLTTASDQIGVDGRGGSIRRVELTRQMHSCWA